MTPIQVPLPTHSVLQPWLQGADFADAWEVGNPQPERSAMTIWLETVRKTPAWIDQAMRLRNTVVSLLGLKNLGSMRALSQTKAPGDYAVGDRAGIFTVLQISDDEVVMGDSDKHLEVRVSLLKRSASDRVVLSTVVHIHNWLGRIYMFFVVPMHRIIAPAVSSKI